MRPGSLAILGIAAYSVFLVAAMPARWLVARFEGSIPGRYQAHDVEGTVWKGSAKAILTDTAIAGSVSQALGRTVSYPAALNLAASGEAAARPQRRSVRRDFHGVDDFPKRGGPGIEVF